MSRLTEVEREIARLEAQRDRLKRRPREPRGRGMAIVWFQKTWGRSETMTYGAIRVTGQYRGWWLTGTRQETHGPKTWDQLLDFVEQAEPGTVKMRVGMASKLDLVEW